MISSTHYSEVITIDLGDTVYSSCGGCELPGSGSWSLIAKTLGRSYFDNNATYGPGTYRLTYLGSTQFNPQICSGCCDFGWSMPRTPEPLLAYNDINLNNWTTMDYILSSTVNSSVKGNHPGRGIWKITGSVAKQTENASPTFLVSDFNLIDQTFTVQITVTDPVKYKIDNDFFGVAWGLSSVNDRPNNYYLLYWKRTSTDEGHAGLSLFRMVNLANQEGRTMFDKIWLGDDWTSGSSQIKVIDRKEGIYWDFNKAYIFKITYRTDGTSVIRVSNAATDVPIWTITFQDPDPLLTGKVAFFDLSQENVNYIFSQSYLTTFVYESPTGTVCTANKTLISFNGKSDDIVALIHADDIVTQDYSGVTGDPLTVDLPEKHFLFNDTSGHIIGNSVTKIFTAGDNVSYTFEESLEDIKTGHVSDMAPAGFNVINWGDPIAVETLARFGWIDKDGSFRFKFIFIPSGSGFIQVDGVTCVEGAAQVNPSTYDWKIIKSISGTPSDIDDAPTIVNTNVDFTLASEALLGVNLVQTPADLNSPKFRLQLLSVTIENPKVIEYTQTNETGRFHNYRYMVDLDSQTFDTANSEDWKYFTWDDKNWVDTNKSLAAYSNGNVKFNIPFDTESTEATVTVIVDGDTSSSHSYSVDVEDKLVSTTPLSFHRDLVPPDILSVKSAVYRIGKDASKYNFYLYSDGQLSTVDSTVTLQNRQTLVAVNKEITSLDRVVYNLNNRQGILKNRYAG